MSLTFTFTGNKPVLENHFFPAIHLEDYEKDSNKSSSWMCGLLNFEVYNSIPNVDETNNCIHKITNELTIDKNDSSDFIVLTKKVREKLSGGTLTVGTFPGGKVKIKCSKTLFNFGQDNILVDLGFDEKRKILEANIEHVSDHEVNRIKSIKKLYFGETYHLPKGSYELTDISRDVKQFGVEIEAIRNQLKCTVKCSKDTLVLDSQYNNIGSLLGFKKLTLISKGEQAVSDHIVDIFKVNSLAIECSIVNGSWKNGQPSHILHTFYPSVAPGYKIIETPNNIVYLDIVTNIIDSITLRILDQEGRLVDFRGEPVTIRLHLKQI